jgi:hypothetical protein
MRVLNASAHNRDLRGSERVVPASISCENCRRSRGSRCLRHELHVIPDSPNLATVEILSENSSGERRRILGMFHAFADDRLTLITDERLAAFTALGVEYNDVLFLGEVIRSSPRADNEWTIDIKIAQILTGLENLMILRAELEQYQTRSKDVGREAPVLCAVLKR